MFRTHNSRFLEAGSDRWSYRVADYWFPAYEVAQRRGFDVIICNNFLHWPVIDFRRMNADCPEAYRQDSDLGSSSVLLQRLLFPLYNLLNKGGSLIIVEPTQFMILDVDQTIEDDAKFHKRRFTNSQVYEEAHSYARNKLLELDQSNNQINQREELFRASVFRDAYPDDEVHFSRDSHVYETDWKRTIIGEFNMTLRNLTEEQIKRVTNGGGLGLPRKFYKRFWRFLKDPKRDIPEKWPEETFYIIVIKK